MQQKMVRFITEIKTLAGEEKFILNLISQIGDNNEGKQ